MTKAVFLIGKPPDENTTNKAYKYLLSANLNKRVWVGYTEMNRAWRPDDLERRQIVVLLASQYLKQTSLHSPP